MCEQRHGPEILAMRAVVCNDRDPQWTDSSPLGPFTCNPNVKLGLLCAQLVGRVVLDFNG